jgi:hypothetical protein
MVIKILFKIEKGYNDDKPFEEVGAEPKLQKIEAYRVHQRTVDNPKKLINDPKLAKTWYENGENHRLVDGLGNQGDKRWITRDEKVKLWVIDCTIQDIYDLSSFKIDSIVWKLI